jgi:hypothetical protein
MKLTGFLSDFQLTEMETWKEWARNDNLGTADQTPLRYGLISRLHSRMFHYNWLLKLPKSLQVQVTH